jgi:succinate dehydrogenase / fumarate reductase cytochrome b subunit
MAQAVAGTRPKRSLPYPLALYQTAVGKKYVMALTGIMWMGYVLMHMAGNLKIYMGAEDLNHYGEWLRSLLVPFVPRTVTLWLLRGGLIAAFALHIHSAYSLTKMNWAKDKKYAGDRDFIAANFASRTMRWTGLIVLLFLAWHLADLTWGIDPIHPDYIRGDVYHNMIQSLERPPVAIFYIVANLALGVHLLHGVWSLFQSMGWNHPKLNPIRRWIAYGFTAIVIGGNLTFPIAIMTGIVE